MKIIPIAIAAAATTISACGAASSAPAAAPTVTITATLAPLIPGTAAPAAATPPRRLTMQQARGAYLRIATPLNQAASVLQADYRDQVPISQYLRDLRHIRAVERRMHRQLDGIRWPARIQGYITALTLTTIPAEIRCASLQQHYTTYQAINTAVNDSQECANGTNLTNADAIRAALDLPQI